MTLVIAWLSVDSRKPCSAYLLTDSRFTWANNTKYDFGQKAFAIKSFPDILAYCGDVLFPLNSLVKLVETADNGLLFSPNATSDMRNGILCDHLNRLCSSYPIDQSTSGTQILHFSRDIDSSFSFYSYSAKQNNRWTCKKETLSVDKSNLVHAVGAGAEEFKDMYTKYKAGDLANTSRNIYQCFVSTMRAFKTDSCGGAPQLVGLYRGKNYGMNFGAIYEGKRYFLGSELGSSSGINCVRWYNENFEICDGDSMMRKDNAMRQPNPNI